MSLLPTRIACDALQNLSKCILSEQQVTTPHDLFHRAMVRISVSFLIAHLEPAVETPGFCWDPAAAAAILCRSLYSAVFRALSFRFSENQRRSKGLPTCYPTVSLGCPCSLVQQQRWRSLPSAACCPPKCCATPDSSRLACSGRW